MRLRPILWPSLAFITVVLIIATIADLLRGPADVSRGTVVFSVAFLAVGAGFAFCVNLFLGVGLKRDRLVRRSFHTPYEVPWARIQAVAMTGDPWAARPTVWTDDGREVELDELALNGRLGLRRAERNCRRLSAHWRLHRGEQWEAAPWAGDGPPWSWQPGTPHAGPDTRVRISMAPVTLAAGLGAFVLLALAGGPVLADPGVLTDQFFWGLLVLPLAVLALSAWSELGVILGRYGLAEGVGGRRQTSWARVQAVTVHGTSSFCCPTLWVEDGRKVSLWGLGVVAGFGRERTDRSCERIAAHWEAHRGPGWRPIRPPGR